jgi:CDP-diacylglycerol---glycerol-3-phosphate 3-phosphatidyltransferase
MGIFIKKNIPNMITIIRVLVMPFFIYALYQTTPEATVYWLPHAYTDLPTQATILEICMCWGFFLFGWTDYLDGWLARKWQIVSSFGMFLDPLVDKLLTYTCLFVLVDLHRYPAWIAIILLLRDFVVQDIRNYQQVSNKPILSVSFWGKWKTLFQWFSIGSFMLWGNTGLGMSTIHIPTQWFGFICAILAMLCSIVSLGIYAKITIQKTSNNR